MYMNVSNYIYIYIYIYEQCGLCMNVNIDIYMSCAYSLIMSDSLQTHGLQPARLLCPWDSPGKNTGVGCQALLQGIFLTQRLNPGFLYCRWILYHLTQQESPWYIYIYTYICVCVCVIHIRFSYKIRNKVRMPALPTSIHWKSWLQQLITKKDIKEIQIDKEFKISLFTYDVIIYISQTVRQFSPSVVSDSLQPHESQHSRSPCPSPTPGVHPDSCSSSWWCHPAISSSVIPFSSCPQSLPASGSFPMSQSLHEVAKVLEFQL